MKQLSSHSPHPIKVPKTFGEDKEYGNLDPMVPGDNGFKTSRLVLQHVPGIPAGRHPNQIGFGRVFLPENGGSVYSDHCHLEHCSSELLYSIEIPAVTHAMYGIARNAVRAANAGRPADSRIRVMANNSDNFSNSWGSHLNITLSREAFGWIFGGRRPHYLAWIASAQASSMVLTGAGKVGSGNKMPWVPYQISQRADFVETLLSPETTFARPLVNSRNECLADERSFARFHSIFFDNTMCHTSMVLRVGLMQMFLAMLESEQIAPGLIFEDPVLAVHKFSADPALSAICRTLDGRLLTCVEHQLALHEQALRFVERGGAEEFVPDACRILKFAGDCLTALRQRNWDFLARRLDWVAKQRLIERATSSKGLPRDGDGARMLDHLWSDIEDGLYYKLEKLGQVELLADESQVKRAALEPPEGTRGYCRAHSLRALAKAGNTVRIVSINWDRIVYRKGGHTFEILMPDPGAGRQVVGNLENFDLDHLAPALGARRISKWQADSASTDIPQARGPTPLHILTPETQTKSTP